MRLAVRLMLRALHVVAKLREGIVRWRAADYVIAVIGLIPTPIILSDTMS
jgi:hypothetical protein